MKKAMLYGLLDSMFFALTFILNRSMNQGGGYWLWSASLRYLFMLPILWTIVKCRKEIRLFSGKSTPSLFHGFCGELWASDCSTLPCVWHPATENPGSWRQPDRSPLWPVFF